MGLESHMAPLKDAEKINKIVHEKILRHRVKLHASQMIIVMKWKIADLGNQPKIRHINMALRSMADITGVATDGSWHNIHHAIMPWRKFDNTANDGQHLPGLPTYTDGGLVKQQLMQNREADRLQVHSRPK